MALILFNNILMLIVYYFKQSYSIAYNVYMRSKPKSGKTKASFTTHICVCAYLWIIYKCTATATMNDKNKLLKTKW